MASVSAVEFLNYVPSVVVEEGLSDYDAVEARIAADPDGVAQLLYTYLNTVETTRSYAVNLSDDTKQPLSELDGHLVQSATAVGYPIPSTGGEVKIRPFVEFGRSQNVLTLVDKTTQSVRDFDVGRRLHVSDGSRLLIATVTAVDVGAGTLSLDEPLVDAVVNITGFVSSDPGRMVDVINFRDWVGDQTGTPSTTLQGFNPELYKLLYAEVDSELHNLTDEELADDYLANPGRIGSVTDLKRAVQSQNIVSAEVDNTLSIAQGAQILFDDGSNIRGIFSSPLVTDPGSSLETLNNLVVTPAALLAVVTREIAQTLADLNAGKVVISETLDVGGTVTVGEGIVVDTINVATDAQIGQNVTVQGDADVLGAIDVSGAVRVRGALLASDTTLEGDFDVIGSTTLTGPTSVSGGLVTDKLTVAERVRAPGGIDAGETIVDALIVRGNTSTSTLDTDMVRTAAIRATSVDAENATCSRTVRADVVAGRASVFDRSDVGDLQATNVVADTADTRTLHAAAVTSDDLYVTRAHAQTMEVDDTLKVDRLVAETGIRSTFFSGQEFRASDTIAARDVTADKLVTREVVADDIRSDGVHANTLEALTVTTGRLDARDMVSAPTVHAGKSLTADTGTIRLATIDELSVIDVGVDNVTVARELVCTDARITGALVAGDLRSRTATFENGRFDTGLTSTVVRAEQLSANSAEVQTVRAGDIVADDLVATCVKSDRVNAGAISATDLVVKEVAAKTVRADAMRGDLIEADTSKFRHVESASLSTDAVEVLSGAHVAGGLVADRCDIDVMHVRELEADGARVNSVVAGDVVSQTVTSGHVGAGTADLGRATVQSLDVSADAYINGTVDIVGRLNSVRADFQTLAAGVIDGTSVRTNSVTTDALDSRTIDTDSVRTSSLYTRNLDAKDASVSGSVTASYVHASSEVRTDRLSVDNSVVTETIAARGSIRCGPLHADKDGVRLTSGTLDARAAECLMQNVSVGTLIGEDARVSQLHADDLVATRSATATATADTLIAKSDLISEGKSAFEGPVSIRTLDVETTATDALTVAGTSVFEGRVDLEHPVISLPPEVYCKDTVTVKNDLKSSRVYGDTLVTSRIVIGPAGMSFA